METSEASSLGEKEVRRRLKTHFIDYDLLAQGDYQTFLEERSKDCLTAIESLCRGDAWLPA